MQRALESGFREWFDRASKSQRKPLILRGARQVGKSYFIRDFCKRHKLTCLEINFERDPRLADLFVDGPNSKTIELLEIHFKATLDANVVLFLDEIQEAPKVFARLRYFYEESPAIAVVAAGSLLEFSLSELEESVPVGRIEYMNLGPMRFEEYLHAVDEARLVQKVKEWHPGHSMLPSSLHDKLIEHVQIFSLIGGMPEAVAAYVSEKKIQRCEEIHRGILSTYRQDFSKYRRRIPLERLQRLFDAVPARVGKKWVHAQVNPNETAQLSQVALDALCSARVTHKVRHSAGNGVPLAAEANEKYYKVLFLDVGLMATQLGLNLAHYSLNETIDSISSGAIAEQWIGQHLLDLRTLSQDPITYYWVREKAGAQAEVDYLLANKNQVVPIEVKAGSSVRAKSLQVFMKEKKNSTVAIHFSSSPPEWNSKLRTLRLPFYMVEQASRILNLLE